MKKHLLWGVGLVFVFLLLLLATAPATLLTRTASGAVPALQFGQVSGSLWQGHAASVRYGDVALEQLQWQLSPWQLLLGQFAVQFELGQSSGGARGNGAVRASIGGDITVQDLNLQVPAQALQPLLKMAGVQFGGELQLTLADAAIQDRQVTRLQGRLIWLQAMVRTPLGQPRLGAYAIDLGADGEGGVNGDISDIDGVLGLTGRVQVSPRGLQLDGSVRSDLPEELDRFFRVVGRPEGDRYALRWQQAFGG